MSLKLRVKLGAKLSILAMIALAGASQAASFSIEPFKVLMVPARGRGTQLFKFANAGDTPQAVQISVQTWAQDEAGNEVNSPDKDSFAVYPDQFVLPPHGTQNVRVTWTADMPKTEQAFRLVAEQLPVTFPGTEEAQALRYLLVYRAALYVAPPKAKSDVAVVGFSKRESDGQSHLLLDLTNQGTAHTLLKAPTLHLEDLNGTKLGLDTGAQIEGLTGQNMLAGTTRRFILPWPKDLVDIKAVSLDFTPGL